jgi:predicted AAA+ superfamily ATPase
MLIDILIKWNRWGNHPLESGCPRQVTKLIVPFIHSEDIVVLTGMRRTGKSTVLYQIMDHLEAQGIQQKAMLHINFEDPAFAPFLELKLLDDLYDLYRAQIYPQGKAYLFFDEIQNVPEWERWVRARNETEDIKIFITGSSGRLMSRELGTLLTGRHVSFDVFPLNLSESLQFLKIDLPKKPWAFAAPSIIQNTIHFLLTWGSLPKVILAENDFQREKLLSQYFDDILHKDIALRHNVRDLTTLRALAVHLLTQTSSLISFQRLAAVFNVSPVLAQNYCSYLKESCLVDLIEFFSLKASLRQRNPQKIHATDLGVRNQVSLSSSEDIGRRIESLVFNNLNQIKNDGIFYLKKEGEIDWVVRRKNSIIALVQVVTDGLEDKKIFERETKVFDELQNEYPQAKKIIITHARSVPHEILHKTSARFVPLWQFLLEPESILNENHSQLD